MRDEGEIRARLERGYYWAGMEATDDVRYLLAALAEMRAWRDQWREACLKVTVCPDLATQATLRAQRIQLDRLSAERDRARDAEATLERCYHDAKDAVTKLTAACLAAERSMGMLTEERDELRQRLGEA